jgi:hypothetical protein
MQVKSLGNPPAGVKMVMEAVCIMMDVKAEKIKDPNDRESLHVCQRLPVCGVRMFTFDY